MATPRFDYCPWCKEVTEIAGDECTECHGYVGG